MRILFGRPLPLCGLALMILAGCTGGIANAPKTPSEFPLFTSADGYAALSVKLMAPERSTQYYRDIVGADTVRFTLSDSSGLLLTGDRVATASLIPGNTQSFPNLFTKIRPGSTFYLKADLYRAADLTGVLFDQNFVRGQGVSGVFALAAGGTTPVTLTVNSVGTIAFPSSESSNYVQDFQVVEGDAVEVNTGVTTTNSPQASRVELAFHDNRGTLQGATTSITVLSSTVAATTSWRVPTYLATLASNPTSEPGRLTITIRNSSNVQIGQKSQQVVVYKGASVGGATPGSTTLN